MTDYQLFLFLAEVLVLLLAARIGGQLAARIGLPLHVGELMVGMMLSPSVLGWIWPAGFAALFPDDPFQRGLLEILSWIGILWSSSGAWRRGWASCVGPNVACWGRGIGGFGLPLVAGFGLGLVFPRGPDPRRCRPARVRPVPGYGVVHLGHPVGMVILASTIGDDTVGWMVLSVVAGLATSGVESWTVARTLLLTAGFVLVAFTIGREFVRRAMRLSRSLRPPTRTLR